MRNRLSNFPKVRPSLPEEFAGIYAAHYKENRGGHTPAASLSQRMEAWLHKRVARDVRLDQSYKTTLEVGAGTLNQLPYEPEVGPYDIVEPFKDLYEGSALLSRIRAIYSDIGEIPKHQQYDRITSIATFEHICNLPEVIARAGRLLKPKGVSRASGHPTSKFNFPVFRSAATQTPCATQPGRFYPDPAVGLLGRRPSSAGAVLPGGAPGSGVRGCPLAVQSLPQAGPRSVAPSLHCGRVWAGPLAQCISSAARQRRGNWRLFSRTPRQAICRAPRRPRRTCSTSATGTSSLARSLGPVFAVPP